MELSEKRQIIVEWAKTPPKERKQSRRGLAQKLGVGIQFIEDVEQEISPSDKGYDSVGFLKSQIRDADIALLESCLKGNAAAQKVLRQILGQLIDRPEKEEGELTADELAKIRNEARKELEQEGYLPQGNREVRPEQCLLPQEIWQGKRPD